MPRNTRFLTGLLIAAAIGSLASAAEQWTDRQGNKFHGEPVAALGPLALFSTSATSGVKPAFRFLTPEDCARFYERVKNKPARVADWTQAQGLISKELIDKVVRLEGDKLVAADLKGRPEPQFFVFLFADDSVGKPWDMLERAVEPFKSLQAAYPGQIEGLFFGIQHSTTEHNSMAARLKMPWLIAEYREQFRHLPDILQFAPTEKGEYSLMVVSREGVPIFAVQDPKEPEIDKLFSDLTALLDLLRPENPRSWVDRVYYQRAAQAAAFAHGHSDPLLVGNPLVAEGLRQRNIHVVDATIAVDADGHVTNVTFKPDSDVPAALVGPLAEALQKNAAFVPAVDNGRFVAGTYAYLLQVPR